MCWASPVSQLCFWHLEKRCVLCQIAILPLRFFFRNRNGKMYSKDIPIPVEHCLFPAQHKKFLPLQQLLPVASVGASVSGLAILSQALDWRAVRVRLPIRESTKGTTCFVLFVPFHGRSVAKISSGDFPLCHLKLTVKNHGKCRLTGFMVRKDSILERGATCTRMGRGCERNRLSRLVPVCTSISTHA